MKKAALGAAERELLSIHTKKAYELYQAGSLKEAESHLQSMQELNPGDVNAVFLTGAITGRGAQPGMNMLNIRKAFQIWHPLFSMFTGKEREIFLDAMSEAFSTMSYTPVEIAARQWDVYLSVEAAHTLAETLSTLLEYDDLAARNGRDEEYGRWIHSLYAGNYVFWLDQVLGVNKPVPVGNNNAVKAYAEVVDAACRMADRIEGDTESDVCVRNRAHQVRQQYFALNHVKGDGSF